MAAGADQRAQGFHRHPQCFQSQAPVEAAAPVPAAAVQLDCDTAAGAEDDSPVAPVATPSELGCCCLAADVAVAVASASHVTAWAPALESDQAASFASALRSALGFALGPAPVPAASRQTLAAVTAAVQLLGSHQTLEAARLTAEGPAESLRTLWAPIQHTETWPAQPAPQIPCKLVDTSRVPQCMSATRAVVIEHASTSTFSKAMLCHSRHTSNTPHSHEVQRRELPPAVAEASHTYWNKTDSSQISTVVTPC